MIVIDRRGSSRLTICIGPWAIKIARNAIGRRCNRYEAELWKRATPARRAMLCPVLMPLPAGLALVMPRAEPLSDEEGDHLMRTDGFPDWDYMPSDDDDGHPFEPKGCDWGRLPNGRLVALDYSTPALGGPEEQGLLKRMAAGE